MVFDYDVLATPRQIRGGLTNRPKSLSFPNQARFFVMVYVKNEAKKRGEKHKNFSDDEVYVVWFSKTCQNWKALVGTTRQDDDMYYEVTHNGDQHETYVDVYKKVDSVCFEDDDE